MTTAYVNYQPGEQLLVKVSFDGGNTFNHPALINTTRGITFTLDTNTDQIMDMNNPSNPAQTVRSAAATDTKIDGAGIMDANSVVAYAQWASTGNAQPIKLQHTFNSSANVSMTVNGYYFLENFQVTGESHKKTTCSLSFVQANAVTVTTP